MTIYKSSNFNESSLSVVFQLGIQPIEKNGSRSVQALLRLSFTWIKIIIQRELTLVWYFNHAKDAWRTLLILHG